MSDLARTLDDILSEIPSLQNLDDYEPSLDFSEGTSVEYDELISKDMAKTILGNRYNPDYEYKLVTMHNATVICQIDHNWPVDKEPVYDSEGRIIAGPLVEIVLEDDVGKDAQSYAEMLMSIERSKDSTTTIRETTYYSSNTRPVWVTAVIAVAVSMVAIWSALLYFLYTNF